MEGGMNDNGLGELGNENALGNPISYAVLIIGVMMLLGWIADGTGLFNIGKPVNNNMSGWADHPPRRDGEGPMSQ